MPRPRVATSPSRCSRRCRTPSGVLVAHRARAGRARRRGRRAAAREGDRRAGADRDLLLVVDNMEHLLDAADLLVELITEAPRLTAARHEPLAAAGAGRARVRGRPPLEVPARRPSDAEAAAAVRRRALRAAGGRGAARLPADARERRRRHRASAAPSTACRSRSSSPPRACARCRSEQILERLDSALTLLVGGARDLPERQRALRSTIQWSVDLLDAEARAALATLSVFAGTFSLESAEAVLAATGIVDPLDALEALVDASLVGTRDQRRRDDVPAAVARARLRGRAAAPERASGRDATPGSTHYRDLASAPRPGLRGGDQLEWLERLERETENLAARRPGCSSSAASSRPAADYCVVALPLPLDRRLPRACVAVLDERAARDRGSTRPRRSRPRARAIAEYYVNAIRFWQEPDFDLVPGLTRSRDLFREPATDFGAALARVSLGLALLVAGRAPDFAAAHQRARAQPRRLPRRSTTRGARRWRSSRWAGSTCWPATSAPAQRTVRREPRRSRPRRASGSASSSRSNHRGWARFLSGDVAGGTRRLRGRARHLARAPPRRGHRLRARGVRRRCAPRRATRRAAGRLLGAAQTLRRRKGILNPGRSSST